MGSNPIVSNRLPQRMRIASQEVEGSSALPLKGNSMLVLSRFVGEEIEITAPDGTKLNLMVVEVRGDKVRLGITAPKEYIIWRKEIQEAIDGETDPKGARNTSRALAAAKATARKRMADA
jgi:carbon storage regulator